MGENSFFSTGTDEHGQKIIRSAATQGFDHPLDLVDDISREYRKTFQKFAISVTSFEHGRFIRTSDLEHHKTAQIVWNRIRKNITVEKYSGWYSTPDEAFIGTKEIEEKDGKKYNSTNGHLLEYIEEENYVFDFAEYLDEIENWAKSALNEPKLILREIEDRRKEGRTKLSISRPTRRVPWGVKEGFII